MLNFLFAMIVSVAQADVHVKAYYRKDGTYVRAHTRSDPGTSSTSREGNTLSFSSSGMCYVPTYIDVLPVIKDEFASCAIETIHNHALDAKTGKPPKECNGYTFNVVHTENVTADTAKDFVAEKWSRFDSRCRKVNIANPPGDATHVCKFWGSYSLNGLFFVKVEKVSAQMPEKICN